MCRWKSLLFKAKSASGQWDLISDQQTAFWLPPLDEQKDRLTKPNTLRMVWVRNPFTRLLAAWMDKALHPADDSIAAELAANYDGPYHDSPAEFARFVKKVVSRHESGLHVDQHFAPQTSQCGMQFGFYYDLYLKVELENT
eukprot:scaffold670625_cov29-Prasinocladus_malaysianus.AAC.1